MRDRRFMVLGSLDEGVVMKRCLLVCVYLLGSQSISLAGPKGDVTVRGVAPGSISIDGSFADWPLDQYTKVTQLPEFPEGQNEFEIDATGDHIVFDIDRVGLFNGTVASELTKDGVQDYGATMLFSHDGEFLYVLGSFIDESARGDRDTSEFGDGGFVNDGWEIFIDALNDTDDSAAGNAFPAFDEEEPNLDDMQITFALNDLFLPDGAPDNVLGARQHMERAGTRALMGPIDEDGVQIRNAPDEGGESYRAFLDAATTADGNPDVAAQAFDDLRAAGAPNPEIAANSNEEFAGYVVEARIPFGIVEGFEPDHKVGMGLFWRDFDNEGDQGGAEQSWMDWTQNTAVACDETAVVGLFCGENWGELVFDDVPEVTQDPLDCNGSGTVDSEDLVCANSSGIRADLQSQLGIVDGDLDGNGAVEFLDFLALANNFGEETDDYTKGDIDGDGSVAFLDFLSLANNFGNQAGGAVASVPEPTSCTLMLIGAVTLGFVSRRS